MRAFRCSLVLVATLASSACAEDSLNPFGAFGDDVAGPPNHAPVSRPLVAESWGDAPIHPGDVVPLDGSASSDPDGDALSYAWTVLAAPASGGGALGTPSEVGATLSADVEGAYVVALTVTDARGLASTETLQLSADAAYTEVPFGVEVLEFTVSSSTCYYVSPVLSGALTIDRDDPSIVFHFASSDFVGIIDEEGNFAVQLYQEFDYTDGCRWAALDELDGSFATPDSFTAAHDYAEWVLSGTDCAPACTVSSQLIGTRTP